MNQVTPPAPSLYSEPIVNDKGRLSFRWMQFLQGWFGQGINTTVTLAKLTGGGANGSLTFQNGILVAKVDPT